MNSLLFPWSIWRLKGLTRHYYELAIEWLSVQLIAQMNVCTSRTVKISVIEVCGVFCICSCCTVSTPKVKLNNENQLSNGVEWNEFASRFWVLYWRVDSSKELIEMLTVFSRSWDLVCSQRDFFLKKRSDKGGTSNEFHRWSITTYYVERRQEL